MTLLTIAEFAALVRQREQSIYRRIRRGVQPGVIRVGRSLRIVRDVALCPLKPTAVETSRMAIEDHTSDHESCNTPPSI